MYYQQERQTQTQQYWLEDSAIHEKDAEYLYEHFLEIGEPQTIDQLTVQVMEYRCRQEEESFSSRDGDTLIYQPGDEYAVGQQLVFSALSYAMGQVVSVREGDNPRHGHFSVIKVQLQGEDAPREFASGLAQEHAVDQSVLRLEQSQDLLSPDQLYELYGHTTRDLLQEALLQNEDFTHLDGHRFLRELMPKVSDYHLNIAEAIIYDHHQPLTISQLLGGFEQADWQSTRKVSSQAYALSYALCHDARFAQLGTLGKSTWFLSDLIPPSARRKPTRLIPSHWARGGEWLSRELHEFVTSLADEADQLESSSDVEPGSVDSVRFFLIHPHLREGTLPLTSRAIAMLPERPAEHFMVTYLDELNKEEIPGWMVPSQGYASGLDEWYRKHEIPIGCELTLSPADAPFTFLVSYKVRKRKREWVIGAQGRDGRLTLRQLQKAPTCGFDKDLMVGESSPGELDELWTNPDEAGQSLFALLSMLCPELAKLDGQGRIHAKTLYSAVNLTRRSGAVPIFAELTRHACFDPVGNGHWVYDESLLDVIYGTPEEMSRRPSSRRQDLIVDRVDQYGMNNEVWGP